MKKKSLMAMLLASALFAGCSSDSPAIEEKTDGTTAYLNVAISMAQADTRATADEDNLYASGTAAEYAVANALFYFYDANGNFVAEAKGFSDGAVDTSDANVDYRSQTMIILTNLDSENLPSYMVTILNRPTGFSGTLLPLKDLLNQINLDYKTDDGNFVMTTASYARSTYKNEERVPYYVTELSDDMFYSTLAAATAADAKTVDVYVERLAAKVQVSLSADLLSSTNTTVLTATDGSKRYLHKITGVNENGKNQLQDYYVELLNWGLDGRMQVSYMMKHINESWTNTDLGFTWNNETDHRSYWGMSYNYSTQGHDYFYPTKYIEGELEEDSLSELKYISAAEISRPFTGTNYGYCMENTNSISLIKASYPSCLTSVVVLARIVDKDGNPLDHTLVNFMNKYYTESDYILTAISQLKLDEVSVDSSRSITLTAKDFQLANVGNGEVFIELSDAGKKTLASDDDALINSINDQLKSFNETAVATAYKDGYMYYNIPIQHRNGNGAADRDSIKEATYGVVRNHWYQISINSVSTLGKGIYDPEEPIIVNDKDQQFYYIGANVNILSWAKLTQSSDL